MKTTIANSWTQTFNAYMNIFLMESLLLILMKWNFIKDFVAGINLALQANTLFERVWIPSFALG